MFAIAVAGRREAAKRDKAAPKLHRGAAARRGAVQDAARAIKEEEEEEELLAWLRALGAEGLEGLRVGLSPEPGKGRAVFAARDFEPGEVLCRVPPEALLIAERRGGTEDAAEEADAASSPEVELAAALLRERRLGPRSRFAPYVASLPGPGVLAPSHPLFWPPGVRPEELLRGSAHGVDLATEALREGAARAAALLASGQAEDEAEARWALAVVDSRAFTFQPDRASEQLALVPLLDMLNTFTLLKDGEELWQCVFEPEGAVSEGALLNVERPIREGDEVLHVYSHNSSAALWMVYGFLEEGEGENPFEVAGMSVRFLDAVASDGVPVREAKLAALASAGLDPEGPAIFELPRDGQAGGTLLPVARLLCCRTLEEVSRLAPMLLPSSEGRPKNWGLELESRARGLVSAWARQALRESEDALEQQLELGRDAGAGTAEGKLRRLAGQLLRRERPVLELELRSSQEFCAAGAQALAQGPAAREAFEAERWDDETGWLGAG